MPGSAQLQIDSRRRPSGPEIANLSQGLSGMAKFGEQRLVRSDVGRLQRALFRVLGVADPAHYLHNLYLRRALARLDGRSPRHILDAGCGAGDHSFFLARRFPSATVLGVDVQQHLIERNRAVAAELGLTNLRFEVADITRMERAERFDLITSIDVLEHIVEQRLALSVLAHHLAPGGMTFFHVPTVRPRPVPFSSWLDAFHKWAEGEHLADEVTAEKFVEATGASGLRVKHWHPTFGYWTGELATSLFALPYRNTAINRIFQVLLILPCRALVHADPSVKSGAYYAVAVIAEKA